MPANVNLSVNDLSFALDCAIATLDGMHADEAEELYGMSLDELDALARRLQAAYGSIREN